MNTRHGSFAILAVLSLATAGNLFAQRRGTSGGGSSGRSSPSGGGSSSSGGSRSSGGSSGRSSGGTAAASGRSSGGSQPSGSRGASTTKSRTGTGSTQASVRGRAADASQPGTAAGSTLPATGKIGAIKRNARAVTAATHTGGGVYYGGGIYIGGCYNCGYWGYYGPAWGWYDYGWWYPARYPYDPHREYQEEGGMVEGEGEATNPNMVHVELSQGYMPYPYAEDDGTGETFVRARTSGRHGYGALSVSYFADKGSTTQAGHVQFETAIRSFHFNVGYDQYVEPLQGHTDRLHSGRFMLGAQPPVGRRAYMIAGVGARGVWLDDHQDAYGPEGTLGLQIFPARPLGLNVTGRLAQMSWTGHDWFTMTEVNTTASVFLWHLELQGGWHWMQMEGSPGFGGPMVGTRIWF